MSYLIEVRDRWGVLDGIATDMPLVADKKYASECWAVDEERRSRGKLWRMVHRPKRVELWDRDVSNVYPVARHYAGGTNDRQQDQPETLPLLRRGSGDIAHASTEYLLRMVRRVRDAKRLLRHRGRSSCRVEPKGR